MRTYTAIITARGGSKGLPGKNLALLAGRPLIAHSIAAALGSTLVRRVVVSTDDDAIAAASRQAGAEVLARPAVLATDTASSVDVVEHALRSLKDGGDAHPDFVLLQPTSPLRSARHLQECLEAFGRSTAACAVSVCECEHHPLKALVEREGSWQPVAASWDALHQPRQSLGRACRPNGAIYAMAVDELLRRRCFVFEPMLPFFMSEADSIDIDTAADLARAAAALVAGPAA